MRCTLPTIVLHRKEHQKMPRRNGQPPGGKGHMKGRSGFGRRRSSIGVHAMRYADAFVSPGSSSDMGSRTIRNKGNEHTQDRNRTVRSTMVAAVDEHACRGCGACVDACPENAIAVDNDVARIDTGRCHGCAVCIESCPFGAISMNYTLPEEKNLQQHY